MKTLLPYILDTIRTANVKHEVHNFDSGAIMIDIFVNDKFYVIQIYEGELGLSLNTDDIAWFDIIPDKSYIDINDFKMDFERIFETT